MDSRNISYSFLPSNLCGREGGCKKTRLNLLSRRNFAKRKVKSKLSNNIDKNERVRFYKCENHVITVEWHEERFTRASNNSYHNPNESARCEQCDGSCLVSKPAFAAYNYLKHDSNADQNRSWTLSKQRFLEYSSIQRIHSTSSSNRIEVLDVPGDGNWWVHSIFLRLFENTETRTELEEPQKIRDSITSFLKLLSYVKPKSLSTRSYNTTMSMLQIGITKSVAESLAPLFDMDALSVRAAIIRVDTPFSNTWTAAFGSELTLAPTVLRPSVVALPSGRSESRVYNVSNNNQVFTSFYEEHYSHIRRVRICINPTDRIRYHVKHIRISLYKTPECLRNGSITYVPHTGNRFNADQILKADLIQIALRSVEI